MHQRIMGRSSNGVRTERGRERHFWIAAVLAVLGVALLLSCCVSQRRRAETLPPGRVESPFCLHGCPERTPPPNNKLLFRDGFVLSNNRANKFADWAAYRVTRSTIGRSKRGHWRPDPDLLEEETLEPEDFRGAHAKLGTDRGHQVPLASFSGTTGHRALNYTSNLTPQRSLLNQKLWNFLEGAVRDLALSEGVDGVYVVTGPLFEREMPKLPEADEVHRIPSGYFKVVALVEGDQPVVAAFIVDQETDGSDSFCDHRASVDEVERRARWDLFAGLDDTIEKRIESAPGKLYTRLGCVFGH